MQGKRTPAAKTKTKQQAALITAQIVTRVKLKEDKTRFKCNVTAGSRSSLKIDWTAFSITVLNRLGALKLFVCAQRFLWDNNLINSVSRLMKKLRLFYLTFQTCI